MDRNHMINQIEGVGFIPTVSFDTVSQAIKVAEVLNNNKIKLMEIMLRSDCALESIEKLRTLFPDFILGVGTIKSEEDIDGAIKRGANFIVLPMFDENLVRYCIEKNILVIPGISSPTELLHAEKLGINMVKFFPAEPLGGVNAIDLISKAFPKTFFIPTGGITVENFKDYLKLEKVLAVGGGFMLDKLAIQNGDFSLMDSKIKSVISKQFNFGIKHVSMTMGQESMKDHTEKNEVKKNEGMKGEAIHNHDISTKVHLNLSQVLSTITKEESALATKPLIAFENWKREKPKNHEENYKGQIELSSDDVWRSYHHMKRNGIEFEEDYRRKEVLYGDKSITLKPLYGGFKMSIVKTK